jgi:hypothetical protein
MLSLTCIEYSVVIKANTCSTLENREKYVMTQGIMDDVPDTRSVPTCAGMEYPEMLHVSNLTGLVSLFLMKWKKVIYHFVQCSVTLS